MTSEDNPKRILLDHELTELYPTMMYNGMNLEVLAATIYRTRARSPRPVPTPDEWETMKARFGGSVRLCYDDVLDMIESGELDE